MTPATMKNSENTSKKCPICLISPILNSILTISNHPVQYLHATDMWMRAQKQNVLGAFELQL